MKKLLLFLVVIAAGCAQKTADVDEKTRLEYFRVKSKLLRVINQHQQAQALIKQLEIDGQAGNLEFVKIKDEIKKACEKKKLVFTETSDDFSCQAPNKK